MNRISSSIAPAAARRVEGSAPWRSSQPGSLLRPAAQGKNRWRNRASTAIGKPSITARSASR